MSWGGDFVLMLYFSKKVDDHYVLDMLRVWLLFRIWLGWWGGWMKGDRGSVVQGMISEKRKPSEW